MITAADALVLGAYSCSGNHHQSLGIMPKAKTRIKDILLYLALLRAGSPVAGIRRDNKMANHSAKTHIALAVICQYRGIQIGEKACFCCFFIEFLMKGPNQ